MNKQADLVEYLLVGLLLMCALLFLKPDLYMHIGKMNPDMLR